MAKYRPYNRTPAEKRRDDFMTHVHRYAKSVVLALIMVMLADIAWGRTPIWMIIIFGLLTMTAIDED